jgi:hypothetical protein
MGLRYAVGVVAIPQLRSVTIHRNASYVHPVTILDSILEQVASYACRHR